MSARQVSVGGCGGGCGCSGGGSCGAGGCAAPQYPFPLQVGQADPPPPAPPPASPPSPPSTTFHFRGIFPWWGYNWGFPWYGLRQQCYFDPRLSAWVCPASPWAFHPYSQIWRMRPLAPSNVGPWSYQPYAYPYGYRSLFGTPLYNGF